MLAFSKLENQRGEVREDAVDLNVFAKNVNAMVENKAQQKDLELDISVSAKQTILSDKNRLMRITMNLVSNAIKFTEDGEVSVRFVLEERRNHDAILKIEITDTGIGIPEEKQDEIFERFTRLDPSHKGHDSGAGLGLNIVKHFVEDLNGTISVDSKLEHGTTFTISIPCKITTEYFSDEKKLPTSFKDDNLEKINANILLVEDNKIIAEVTKRSLIALGCTVDVAGTAKAALELLNPTHDFVLLDIGLPDEDGFYVAREIRKCESKVKDIPIVAHTAHLDEAEKQQAFDAGMNEFLTKPTNKEQLSSIIRQLLK